MWFRLFLFFIFRFGICVELVFIFCMVFSRKGWERVNWNCSGNDGCIGVIVVVR